MVRCARLSVHFRRSLRRHSKLPGGQVQIAHGGQVAENEGAAGRDARAQALAEGGVRRQHGLPQGGVSRIAALAGRLPVAWGLPAQGRCGQRQSLLARAGRQGQRRWLSLCSSLIALDSSQTSQRGICITYHYP